MPAAAYAEEDEEGQADLLAQASTSGTITIVATKIDQVCVSVIDIGKGLRSATTVSGAKVRLKSYATEKTVAGTTNDQGVVVLNIADLAEPVPKTKGEYTFRAFVEMSAPGYRIFRTGIALVNGGKGLEIATEKVEPGVPYPSRASFDDWDVLYTNNSWTLYKKNDYSHDLVVELEGVSTHPLTVKFADNDGRVFTEGTVSPRAAMRPSRSRASTLRKRRITPFLSATASLSSSAKMAWTMSFPSPRRASLPRQARRGPQGQRPRLQARAPHQPQQVAGVHHHPGIGSHRRQHQDPHPARLLLPHHGHGRRRIGLLCGASQSHARRRSSCAPRT